MSRSISYRNLPSVQRITREFKELQQDPDPNFSAHPLEDNLFEWHFTIRGPPDSAFEDGIYHGRILLSHNYPLNPPDIILLTNNGRFVVGHKICLSISGYHKESWVPAWGIRTALIAIISFMTSPAAGAIGGVDSPDEERRRLAKLSSGYFCPTCKTHNRDVLPVLPVLSSSSSSSSSCCSSLVTDPMDQGPLDQEPEGRSAGSNSCENPPEDDKVFDSQDPDDSLIDPARAIQAPDPAGVEQTRAVENLPISDIVVKGPKRLFSRSTFWLDLMITIVGIAIVYLLSKRLL